MSDKNVEIVNVQPSAGQVNSQAMETVQGIVGEAVNQPALVEQDRKEHLRLLQAMRISTQTEIEPEAYSLSVDGVGIFALGDVHAIKGKQKSGKSGLLKVCAASLLRGQMFRVKSELKEPQVLFIDTEQQSADVKLVISEVKHLTGLEDDDIDQHLHLYTLRRRSYDTLLDDTRLLIDTLRPQVVFIDGLVDYVASFNDEVLSRQLIHELLKLCEEYHCAIVNVLHENKALDDANMRGHLGTVLAQKSGTVLQCQKTKTGIINITCPDARHGQMPAWNIGFGSDGHILDADLMQQQQVQAAKKQKAEQRQAERDLILQGRLEKALDVIREHSGSMLRSELTVTLTQRLKLSRPVVSKFITQMVKEGKLIESDKSIMNPSDTVLPF